MPTNKLFGGGVAIMEKALDLRAQRQNMIQSNIANLETPGYKVQEMSFTKVMEKVRAGGGALTRTHPDHLAVDPAGSAGDPAAYSENRPADLDEEMVKLAENQLMYQVTTRIITKRFEGLKFAIEEGGGK